MSRKLLITIPVSLFFFLVKIPAQDITGVWTGFINTNGNQLHYELAISETKDKLNGYSLTVFTIDGVENEGIKSMKIKMKKGKVTIEDDKLISDNYSIKAKRVMLFSVLSLTNENSVLVLSGKFNSLAFYDPTYKGTIRLQKKNSVSKTRIISKLDQMNLLHTLSFIQPNQDEKKIITATPTATKEPEPSLKPKKEKADLASKTKKEAEGKIKQTTTLKIQPVLPPAADIANRKTETIQTVYFSSDSILISLYDNGQIDDDTVSVVLNGSTIIAKERLTSQAITKTIYTPFGSGDSLQLVMYAENLGIIPPNTGLLIVQEGNNRYEIRFEGNFQKNSAIILKRKRGF